MSWLLPATALFPLLLLLIQILPGLKRHAFHALPLAALPALAAGIWLPDGLELQLPHVLMDAAWRMDRIGRVFLLFTSLGWWIASLFSVATLKDHPRKQAFAIPFLVAMSGNLLLPSAADSVTFYTGFTVMGFASWGLIVFNRSPEAFRAGRIYLSIVLLGEFLVLPGLIKGSLATNSFSMSALQAHWDEPGLAVALLAIGFALKAGLFPLHVWLPLAHPAAPSPASAVLSGCMIKTALLAWLRLLPLGSLSLESLAQTLAVLATLGIIGGAIAALFQRGAKALLAYTSLSKMGLMLLLLCLGLSIPEAAEAAILAVLYLAVFHALHKGALFLGSTLTPSMGILGRILLLLLCASYCGMPFLGGALAKEFINPLYTVVPAGWAETLSLLLLLEAMLSPAIFFRFARMTWPQQQGKRNPFAELVWSLAVLFSLSLTLLLFLAARLDLPLRLPPLKGIPLGDPGFFCGVCLTALYAAAGLRSARNLPPGDLIQLIPASSRRWNLRVRLAFKGLEQQLNQSPGGVAFLAVMLLVLTLMMISLP